jgi:hypothetical protein
LHVGGYESSSGSSATACSISLNRYKSFWQVEHW